MVENGTFSLLFVGLFTSQAVQQSTIYHTTNVEQKPAENDTWHKILAKRALAFV